MPPRAWSSVLAKMAERLQQPAAAYPCSDDVDSCTPLAVFKVGVSWYSDPHPYTVVDQVGDSVNGLVLFRGLVLLRALMLRRSLRVVHVNGLFWDMDRWTITSSVVRS